MAELILDGHLEYTLDEYEHLLESLLQRGYEFTDFSSPASDGQLLLRHDVDLCPQAALEMARIEARYDVESTYCFLVSSPAYNLLDVENATALDEILALGHEVALHFDTHQYWTNEPPLDALRSAVLAECDTLSRLVDRQIHLVSFHQPPEWVLDVDFDGFVNTYQPAFFSAITYRSDSNQKWRSEPPLRGERPDRLQLLVHPGLWAPSARRMAQIVEERSADRREHVNDYFEALGA